MAQAFVTTYQNHYRWHTKPKRKSKRPLDRQTVSAPASDFWIDLESINRKKDLDLPYAKALMNQSRAGLMFSTYQINYCQDEVEKKSQKMRDAVNAASGESATPVKKDQSFENELLQYCEDLYSPKRDKLLPPGETARRVFGSLRPEALFTPLTNYQSFYGKAGYDVMRNPKQYLNIREEKIPGRTENSLDADAPKEDSPEENVIKLCEELKTEEIVKEKQDRRKKLYCIFKNLHRCTNHSKNAIVLPCEMPIV